MSQTRKRDPMAVSPPAQFKYAHLTRPDDKFGDPTYKVTATVQPDAAGYDAFLSALTQAQQQAEAAARAAGFQKMNPPPFSVGADGALTFEAKQLAEIRTGDKVIDKRPKITDQDGNEIDQATPVYAGSVGRVAMLLHPYQVAKGSGLTLRLYQVRVLELVTGSFDPFAEDSDAFGGTPPPPAGGPSASPADYGAAGPQF